MYHTIIIVGNLGRDPEMRYTPSGQAVTNFSLASNRTYTGKDGQRVKETIWFRITVWGKQAESCNNYLQKGGKVLVEGRLNPDENGSPRIWNRQDGTPAASFEVTANTVRFLDSRGGADSGDAGDAGDGMMDSEDEIPF
ncbi:MAG: single-stranded DNA-binding protein [Anaerolineaceae bacterium]|jgi:single-strand DNA-binding protein|nr:single-stranded DNA-binding protein [Anaerolineaceae bacterium]